jgi:hypothetical protein
MKGRVALLFVLALVSVPLVVATPGSRARAQRPIQKGMSYAAWWSGEYSTPDADLSLQNLTLTGTEWISLIVTGFQDTVSSTTISFTTLATPTDADLAHVIGEAHELGLKVMLKPHVDLLAPDSWRGQIGEEFTTEGQWEAWFASYRNFIEHYAELAQTYGADQFSVGTELVGTSHREEDWRAVIAGVRARYDGPLVYAALYGGEETRLTWWDAVDYIGVDAYYELTDRNDPSMDELRAAWSPHVTTLANLADTWGKAIVLTEVGYRSLDGANRYPYDSWSVGSVDLEEQADAYQAAFESVCGQPWLAGMFWWYWRTDPSQGGVHSDDYTPHNKPAEQVLSRWYHSTSLLSYCLATTFLPIVVKQIGPPLVCSECN